MAEHLTEKEIRLFHTGRLAPEQLLSAGDHIAACRACASLATKENPMLNENISLLRTALSASPERDQHLRYEQLEGYASERLSESEQEQAEKHISSCRECETEIRQFRSLSEAMRTAASPAVTTELSQSFLRSLRVFFTVRNMAFVSATLASLIAVGWFAFRTADRGAKQSEFTLNQPPTSAPSVNAPSNLPIETDVQNTNPPAPQVTLGSNDSAPGLRVSLSDAGKTVGVTRKGELEGYSGLPAGLSRSVKEALASGAVRIGDDVGNLRASRGVLMSGEDPAFEGLQLMGPAGVVVMTDRPRLSWKLLPGAESYIAEVFDEKFNKVASSGPQPGTTWSPRLPRGRTYIWQVTATRGSEQFKAPQRPAPEAKFKVLARDKFDEIEQMRRSRPNHHLVLGVLFAQAGLLTEALNEFEMLARGNPNSPLPRKFISQMRRELHAGTK